MQIKKFQDFISEKFILQRTDEPTLTQAKKIFNEEEDLSKSYDKHKALLLKIYRRSTNQDALINDLFNNKYLLEKTKNPKKLQFKNKYLGRLAQICQYHKNIEDLEIIIQDANKNKQSAEMSKIANKDRASVVDNSEKNIQRSDKDLAEIAEKIKHLENEIVLKEKELRKEIQKIGKDLPKTKKEIMKKEIEKKSAPAKAETEEK